MSTVQILTLLLALSCTVNLGCAAGFLAARSGLGPARAVLVAGSATGGSLALFFAAVAAYH
jgi:hypothetical protein